MKRTVKRVCAAGLVLMAVMAGCAVAGLVDQSQTGYASFNDLHGDGLSGQTFTAGQDGELVGIRLLVSGAGYTNGPYGSAVRVNLRTVSSNKVVSSSVAATGTRAGDGIGHNVPVWIEVLFDQPYHQSAGQMLAFTITDLSGGGRNGWNNYGMITGNPYAGGQQFYSFSTSPLSVSNWDMAFETIIVPEPATLLTFCLGTFLLRRPARGQSKKPV